MNFTDVKRIDCTPEEYFKIDAVSNSDLGRLNRSPAEYLEGKTEETSYMKKGSAFDSYILTPDDFFRDYATVPEDMTVPSTDLQVKFFRLLCEGVSEKEAARMAGYKKAPKQGIYDKLLEYREEKNGKELISWEDAGNIERMERNLMNNALAKKIIAESEKQVVFTGIHAATGLLCKSMLDLLWPQEVDVRTQVDLKTSAAKDRFEFRRGHFFKFGYDRQSGMYKNISGSDNSALIVVSTVSNWTQVIPLAEYTPEGEAKAERLLEALSWHKENDSWAHSYEYEMNGGWEEL